MNNENKKTSNGMWYVYLLQSKKNKRWYTGCTSDLRKRFKQHNNNEVTSLKVEALLI